MNGLFNLDIWSRMREEKFATEKELSPVPDKPVKYNGNEVVVSFLN